jgi:hypothetical protein
MRTLEIVKLLLSNLEPISCSKDITLFLLFVNSKALRIQPCSHEWGQDDVLQCPCLIPQFICEPLQGTGSNGQEGLDLHILLHSEVPS